MSLTPKPTKALEVFFSYAHKDQRLRDQLETQLSLLKREGLISSWHDRKIGAGEEWAGKIDTHLNTAQIILLLVSADFIASDYCYDIEMKRALERHETGEARVIPVILRRADWKSAPFGKLQALPQNGKPVASWAKRDEAFFDVARGIREIVEKLSTKSDMPHNLPSTSRGIVGFPPLTDPKTIQQRKSVVEDVYGRLTQPDISAIVLTGIGGVGKSTLAALVYRYAQEQHNNGSGPFAAEPLWLTIDPAVTFADIAGNICTALGKPIPDFGNLALQNQAAALFNALKTADKPRLIVLDQFENLLDGQTGHALADRPGVGEWIDVLNSQKLEQSGCRVLLTSRPRPKGTREYPPTCMEEYAVAGLKISEGTALLRNQGVNGTDAELRTAVEHCDGHAYALVLLATLSRDYSMGLTTILTDPTFWKGDIAANLLDHIYTQLSEVQRELLRAFSLYREPVPLEAAQALITRTPKAKIPPVLKTLRTQQLIQAPGEGRYQLHAIVADYARDHFVEDDEQANRQTLNAAHAKAAQYYLQQAKTSCPPRDRRRRVSDVQPLIEAAWQLWQAEQWRETYDLVQNEGIFVDLKNWGGNAALLELCKLLLPLDRWQPERLQEADICYYLGSAYEVLGQKKQAIGYYEQALEIHREVKDRKGEGAMLNNLGKVYDALGKKQEALAYYEQALGICREVGDRWGEGTMLNNLGKVYDALGKKQEALAYYEQALSIRREVGDRWGEGVTLNNLGLVYDALGKKQEALAYYEQALSIHREVGDRGGEGVTLHNIGTLYFERSRYEVALACFLLARGIFEDVQSPNRDVISNPADHYMYGSCNRLEKATHNRAKIQELTGFDMTQQWIDALRKAVGEQQFATLLAQVEPQARQVVENALHPGL